MDKKILIIEDNESVAAMLCSNLEHAGFSVIVAADAMMGTQACVKQRPDLVLLDLMMPAGGGQAVLRNIRNSVYTKNTPVIVLTGSNDPAVRKQVLEFGVQTVIQKPADSKELIALIKKTLGLPDIPPPAAAV